MGINLAKWLGSVILFGVMFAGTFVSAERLVCHVCHDKYNCNTEDHNDTEIYYEKDRKMHRYGTIKCGEELEGFYEHSHFCASVYINGQYTVKTCMMVEKTYDWTSHPATTTEDCPPAPGDGEVLCACYTSKCTGCCKYPYTPEYVNSEIGRLMHVARYRELPDGEDA